MFGLTLEHENGLQNQVSIEANLRHSLSKHVELKAQLKAAHLAGKWSTQGMIAATIYFDIPAAKRVGLGTITGKVYDGEREFERGLANVIVRVGTQSAVTAKDGLYELAGLQPGVYYLQIDGTKLPKDLIPAISLGVPIVLEAEQLITLDIPMVQKASIHGQIKPEGIPRFTGSAEGVVIHARRGDDIFTAVSNADGVFHFADLYPGVWEITVNSNGWLKPMHTVDITMPSVVVNPGSSAQVDIKVRFLNNRVINPQDH